MNSYFDEKGNLQPYEVVDMSLDEFANLFIMGTYHRQQLFDNCLLFLEEVKSISNRGFWMYIDGSFTTLKEKPNDIDVVIFLDYRVFDNQTSEIERLKIKWKSKILDCYFARYSYPGHSGFMQYLFAQDFWESLFLATKPNKETGKRNPKGLIKITFK